MQISVLLKPNERKAFAVSSQKARKNAEAWNKEDLLNRNHTIITKQKASNLQQEAPRTSNLERIQIRLVHKCGRWKICKKRIASNSMQKSGWKEDPQETN